MIHLAVGRLEIDWGKNGGFADHSPLFQVTDVAKVPYYYVDHHDGDLNIPKSYIDKSGEEKYQLVVQYQDGMSKPLSQVVERIRLLGYSLESCKTEFAYLAELSGFDADRFSFDLLKQALATIDVQMVSADYGEMGEDFGKFFRRELFPRLGFEAISDDPDYIEYYAGEGMENLSAYTVLQLLAFNPSAADLPVTWQFADVEEGGWAERGEFCRELAPNHRFLIVTEGSSDAKIIRHAFALLRPHIADFFDFVDMEEGYPFSGTGNVHRFLQGLISISIQNSIVVLYDNDAEGVWSYHRSRSLNLPVNIRILKLPESQDFVQFETVGPSGRFKADINGRAAAIECYLDLGTDAFVRWTSFKSETETYQGELLGKTSYMRTFLSQKVRKHDYDYTRIEAVLDLIINSCAEMKSEIIK